MSAASMPHLTSPDSSQDQPSMPMRWPPALQPNDLSGSERPNAQQLRNEKLNRRESRLGLRSIFGRAKSTKQPEVTVAPRLAKPLGRDNETEGIPYYTLPPGKPTARSNVSRPLSTTFEDPSPLTDLDASPPVPDIPRRRTLNPQPKNTRGNKTGVATWDAPPLHKAYPEATRYSTLPATTVPADVILRAYEKKAGESANGPVVYSSDNAKSRRRHRKTKSAAGIELEWTTKTYILMPSGYLLEYASEGPFDRLPEKALRLDPSSAAFASDLIPGRHWVLQVTSAKSIENNATNEPSKSLFSKLPFRGGTEKRSASSMLLVFDNADTMDEWLMTLRRSIEDIGGKTSLSETGSPKSETVVRLREQASQRTLLVRDSTYYSRSIPESQPWEPKFGRRDSDVSFILSEGGREQSIDELSTTNSVVSHDGQQLESLRNSANRLSCISSGQRTMITSAGSSPACSPTLEEFPTSFEEPSRRYIDSNSADSKLRHNASAILDRRRSMQTMSPYEDYLPHAIPQRPHSTMISGPAASANDIELNSRAMLSPNFSVPHTSNRRYSARMSTMEVSSPASPPRELEPPSRSTSRRPPTSLRISRPLSMVEDQPSPREIDVPDRPATRHGETLKPSGPELALVPPPAVRPESRHRSGSSSTPNENLLYSPPRQTGNNNSPRRLSSMGALRKQADGSLAPVGASQMRMVNQLPARSQTLGRCHSTIDPYERSTGLRPPPRPTKRSSMLPALPGSSGTNLAPPLAPPPSIPLPPIPQSSGKRTRPDSNAHSLLSRRSLPQLPEGPPLPPPTCALPPIPSNPPQGYF